MLLNVSLSGWLCSCIEWEVQNTWMALNEVVGGIYSPETLPSCWLSLLSMGAPDSPVVHQTVIHVSAPIGVWSC
jgi:ABC-type phosphate transport system auxiliary subunit